MFLIVDCDCVRFYFLFFFSSRRRHTRLQGDWSSDVCSSDLGCSQGKINHLESARNQQKPDEVTKLLRAYGADVEHRSEERRVGKECRSRWSAEHGKKQVELEREEEAARDESARDSSYGSDKS